LNTKSMNNNKFHLAVIPSDPLAAYKQKGTSSWLDEYYNPMHFFDKVYLLSPLEKESRCEFGMIIVPTMQNQLKERIKELNIDVVRAYGGYWASDMACYNKVKGVPVIVSVHDTNPQILHESIRKADIVFCVSAIVRSLVLKKFARHDRVWILPNRVNLETMRPSSSPEISLLDNTYPYQYKILHVGRKSYEKNLDTVIKALKILGKEYCLVAIGIGNTKEYIELAKAEGVAEQCYFLDSVANEDLGRYYSWANCVCNPSRWEGFGVVFLEALACAGVVVTSDIPPMNEYITHMSNGILIKDYENPLAVAEMIVVACRDVVVRESIKGRARESIIQFAKRKIDQQEVHYYKTALEMRQNNEFNASLFKRIFRAKSKVTGYFNNDYNSDETS
jgi:glycosyltransferase involved in cell wall biosynthesis